MGACIAVTRTTHLEGVQPREVHVTLEREGRTPLGLRLGRDRVGVVTRGVDQGSAMERWNEQHPTCQVSRGDRLLSVNGVPAENSWNGWCAILTEFRKNVVHVVILLNPVQRWRRTGSAQPSVSPLDQIVPDQFLDDLPDSLECALGCEECPICLEELTQESRVVVLPCRHAYHYDCAERLLMKCPTFRYARCPTCRKHLPHDAGTTCLTRPVSGGDVPGEPLSTAFEAPSRMSL
mmetsp:Transcript_27392/g.81632  ORF Transcript_27392/g.81632 Transcript_27392/m.81632 type:complete len:235 (+) Transcript_27392:63-767(+)